MRTQNIFSFLLYVKDFKDTGNRHEAMGNGNTLAEKPAEQLIGGNVQCLADDVVHRGVDGGFTIWVALHGLVHHGMNDFETTGVLAG